MRDQLKLEIIELLPISGNDKQDGLQTYGIIINTDKKNEIKISILLSEYFTSNNSTAYVSI